MRTPLSSSRKFDIRHFLFQFSFRFISFVYFVYSFVNSLTLDEKMDLDYICTAQRCCKHIFAPEQTCSKRGKVHICYHIYTDVQIWWQMWTLPYLHAPVHYSLYNNMEGKITEC